MNAFDKYLNEMNSMLNERSINKIQAEFTDVVNKMAAMAKEFTAANGDEKANILAELKALTIKKNSLLKEIDVAVAGKDKDVQLVVTEAEINEAEKKAQEYAEEQIKDYLGESNIAEAYGKPAGLTKDETMVIAQKFADAMSKAESAKVTVNKNTLEEDSFDLDYNGEEFDGGSYNIYQNGDVMNMALRENPVYGKKNDSVDTIAKNMKKFMAESIEVNEVSKRAIDFYGDSKYGSDIHSLLNGKWDSSKVENYLEKLGGGNDTKYARIIDFISGDAGLNIRKYKNIGEQLPDLMKQLEILYKDFLTESLEVVEAMISVSNRAIKGDKSKVDTTLIDKLVKQIAPVLNNRANTKLTSDDYEDIIQGIAKMISNVGTLQDTGLVFESSYINESVTNETVTNLEEGVNMEELEDTLKRVKKENPGKKVSYFFTKDSAKGYMISIDGKQIKESEDLDESVTNEARHIMVKRQYTENHPASMVGKIATVRNKVLEAIKDGKISSEQFEKIVSDFSNNSKKWTKNNSKYFTIAEDGIMLSSLGKKVLSSIRVNEADYKEFPKGYNPEVWVPGNFDKDISKYSSTKLNRKIVLDAAKKWDVKPEDAIKYVEFGWSVDLSENNDSNIKAKFIYESFAEFVKLIDVNEKAYQLTRSFGAKGIAGKVAFAFKKEVERVQYDGNVEATLEDLNKVWLKWANSIGAKIIETEVMKQVKDAEAVVYVTATLGGYEWVVDEVNGVNRPGKTELLVRIPGDFVINIGFADDVDANKFSRKLGGDLNVALNSSNDTEVIGNFDAEVGNNNLEIRSALFLLIDAK